MLNPGTPPDAPQRPERLKPSLSSVLSFGLNASPMLFEPRIIPGRQARHVLKAPFLYM